MFCPQCGHQQVSSDRRFCSNCGLSLSLVTDLLATTSTQLQREKREITGIGMMIATIIMLINFIIIFGAATLPHLINPVYFWVWAFFVISSLSLGGAGLANLIRSGFFKRLKEREMRLNLMKLEEKRQVLSQEAKSTNIDVESVPRLVEPVSVTETTTRELQAIPRQRGETSRMKEAITKD
jgi:hypothetical protein